ncbi:uncharacterized protein LOC132057708 [Lycium ferocissimum]|uniref:uncharacterized protein LOC132057708 n=1 Tax=Lycium ferocissimum TaxID=112874 RepID=UPI0028169D96|nr:uncharacterized protein LOC132057708 [Lycium ferocissimum]
MWCRAAKGSIHLLLKAFDHFSEESGKDASSKKALVAWDTMCLPKAAGGLNIIDFVTWNRAAICKLLWAMSHKKDTLWVQWLHSFYIKRQDLASMETPRQACWLFAHGGRYSIKKTSITFEQHYARPEWKNLLLSLGTLPRHNFILWLVVQNKLTTIDRLAKWNIQVLTDCVLLKSSTMETMQHLFFDCHYSKFIWKTLLSWVGITRQIGSWAEKVKWLSHQVHNNRPRSSILGFLIAASVYHI